MFNYKHRDKLLRLLLICGCWLLVNSVLADPESDNFSNKLGIETTGNVNLKGIDSEYQVEVLLFKHKPQISSKEIMVKESKELSKHNTVNFSSKYVKPKFLLKDYAKLQLSKDHQVVFYAAAKYNLLPTNRTKKFFITTDDKNEITDNSSNFNVILTIFQTKPNFHVTFNGIIDQFTLLKSAKIKSKEVYYFDHPMFGALVTVVALNK